MRTHGIKQPRIPKDKFYSESSYALEVSMPPNQRSRIIIHPWEFILCFAPSSIPQTHLERIHNMETEAFQSEYKPCILYWILRIYQARLQV